MTSVSAETSRYPAYIQVAGGLPNDMRLRRPIEVLIEEDGGEYVVSEQDYHMHGFGPDPDQAIEDFRRVLADSYEMLTSDEASLGPQLREQLVYLRSILVHS